MTSQFSKIICAEKRFRTRLFTYWAEKLRPSAAHRPKITARIHSNPSGAQMKSGWALPLLTHIWTQSKPDPFVIQVESINRTKNFGMEYPDFNGL